MKIGVLLAALALLMPTMNVVAQGKVDPKADAKTKEALKDPSKLKEKAPATFKVKFLTTKGEFLLDVTRAWSPNGADRFYNLVKHGFFDGVKFFRVVPNFVVQFGIHGDQSNKRGFITYAKSSAPNSRSTQLFINLKDNDNLDALGFSAFGKVTKGMDVVDKLYSGYGEQLTRLQGQIAQEGNKYLDKNWPKLDSIKKATLVK
jgi:peptidyl-prolyl cis-trans isomerase A (cyclophilin A)